MSELPPFSDPAEQVAGLVKLMDLQEISEDLFQGPTTAEPWARVFGGQSMGQALIAATRTVAPDRLPHSLHTYFLHGGDPTLAITYRVSRDRDGGSFSTRRVEALQAGRPILHLACSFQRAEPGVAHQFDRPDAPPPEELEDERVLAYRYQDRISPKLRALMLRERPIEIRPTLQGARFSPEKHPPQQGCWFRARAPLPKDQTLHRALLAYASDFMLLGTSALPHALNALRNDTQKASLDHALWIHGDVDLDDWLFYAMESPWAGNARGFNRGMIFARDGRLIASVAQEALMRVRVRGES